MTASRPAPIAIPGTPAYRLIALQFAQAMQRLESRRLSSGTASRPEPLPTIETQTIEIDLDRVGRRGPYQRRARVT